MSEECSTNARTTHLAYGRLQKSPYISLLGPQIVRVLFRTKLRMFDFKTNFKRKYTSHSCLFCGAEPETFDHLFTCTDVLHCSQCLKDVTLQNLANANDIDDGTEPATPRL